MTTTIFVDNTYGTIAAGLSPSDTSISLTTGHGVRFPVVASPQILYAVLFNSANVLEEIHITAHTASSDTLTVTRAANGTTGKSWFAGDRIECRVTSEHMNNLVTPQLESAVNHGALGDWNGTSGTDNTTAILEAIATGNSVLIGPDRSGNKRFYAGTLDTGTVFTFLRSGQCIHFEGGASLVVNGNNGVPNSAVVFLSDSLDGNFIYNPIFESNRSISVALDRDSPHFFSHRCTTGDVNGGGIINGKGTKAQSMYLAEKVTFGAGTFEVYNPMLHFFADRCFYGAIGANTVNNINAQIDALDCHRAIDMYGVNGGTIDVIDRHEANLTLLAQSIVGVGINNEDTTNKSCTGLTIRYVTRGSTFSGPKFLFSAQYSTAGLVAFPYPNNPQIRDIDLFYDDTGNATVSSIGFQNMLDGVNQTSFTGKWIDGITINGRAVNAFDMTMTGAIGSPTTQTVKGYADFSNLTIATLSGTGDPMNGYLFDGIRAHWAVDNLNFTPTVVGLSSPGTANYTVQTIRGSKVGKSIFIDINLTWDSHTGTGNISIDCGTLFTIYPVVSGATGYVATFEIITSLTYTGDLKARIQTTETAILPVLCGAGAPALVPIAAAGSINISGRYETNT